MTLYQLLGVDASVSGTELGRAYRRRLRQLHPDLGCAVDADLVDAAADLAAVQQAYQVLRDPARRARYDAELEARAVRVSECRPTRSRVSIAVRVHPEEPRCGPVFTAGPVRVAPLPPSPAR